MKIKHILQLTGIVLVLGCSPMQKTIAQNQKPSSTLIAVAKEDKQPSQEFWDALSARCGKTYEGYITLGAKIGNGFTGEKLIMHIRKCEENVMYIPFNVGDNLSRTWILRKDKDGLISLKHDHREEDGSDDKVTMYGGKSINTGTKNTQTFPADKETQINLPHAATNIWWMTIDDETFTYNFRRLGKDYKMSVIFDLKTEKPTPPDSWGWEGK